MTNPALLLIDIQEGFNDPFWGKRNNLDAEENAASLLALWRDLAWPIIHVQHLSLQSGSPLAKGAPGVAFRSVTKPMTGEKVFQKSVNSAFIGTGLEEHLRAAGVEKLVIVGLTTDHCVSTTTRMAGNLGFDVTLVSDATATFDRAGHDGSHHSAEEIHQIHLASLHEEFCTVRTTQEVIGAYTLR